MISGCEQDVCSFTFCSTVVPVASSTQIRVSPGIRLAPALAADIVKEPPADTGPSKNTFSRRCPSWSLSVTLM